MKGFDMSKAIILVRVSSQIQNTEPQLEKLVNFSKQLGFDNDQLHIIETKESGLLSSKQREGFEQLKNMVEVDDSYKTLICSEISRLSRRQSSLHELKDWLIQNKIQLHVYEPRMKLFGEDGKVDPTFPILFTVIGQFAESELIQKRERTTTALKSYASKGYSLTSKELFGYDKYRDPKIKKNRYEIDSTNGKIVNEIFNWYLNGLPGLQSNETSIVKIARYCAYSNYPTYTHSKRNINKLLKEKAYTGGKNFKFDAGESLVFVPYPPIIPKEIFDKVQEKLSIANSCIDKSVKTTLLARKIICPNCKNKFTANYSFVKKVNRSCYRCGSRTRAISCKNKQTIDMRMLDSAIWSLLMSNRRFIRNVIENEKSDYSSKLTSYSNQLLELNARLEFLKNQETELSKAIVVLSLIDDFDPDSLRKLNEKLKSITDEIFRSNRIIASMNQNKVTLENLILNADVLNQEFSVIEKNKIMIKKYIDALIQSIEIIQHNRSLSIFVVNFTRPFFLTHPGLWEWENPIDLYPITLIIEKHNPSKKKLFWINGFGKVNGENLDILDPIKLTQNIEEIVSNVTLSELKQIEQVSDELPIRINIINIEDLDKLPREMVEKLSIEELDQLTQDEPMFVSYDMTQIPNRKLSFPDDNYVKHRKPKKSDLEMILQGV